MSEFVNVLDHGHVGLVGYLGSDLEISRAARVSYNAEPRAEDGKLIHYLLKNKHTSPFEAVVFTFDVKAPIFVFRQWHRHRTWSYNEVSARYVKLPTEYYVPDAEVIGTQSKDNKQVRDMVKVAATEKQRVYFLQNLIRTQCSQAFDIYEELLACGMPRELARSVLPVATYSHMFATVDLHNLFHFIKLRMHSHAQWEIQQYAKAMLHLIEPIVPEAVKAFKDTLDD